MRSLAFSFVGLFWLSGLAHAWAQPAAEISVPRGRIAVRGRVVDEAGAPIAGATISVSSETDHYADLTSAADGTFVAIVRPTSALRLAAAHPSYGTQWADMDWRGWSRYDAIPPDPVQLTLRAGVVLRGRLLDIDGSPRAHETLLLVPAYVGSGPPTITATTDANGEFVFPRAVLNRFELVVRSLAHWHPETQQRAGDYLEIAQQTADWLARARADQPIEIRITPLTLVTVHFTVTRASGSPVARTAVDLWLRTAPTEYVGTVPRTDAQGGCSALIEPHVAYEIWVSEDHGTRTPPWTEGIAPTWRGSVDGTTTLPLTLP